MAGAGCSKANGRKHNNKTRQARKRASWLRGQKRKDKLRLPTDPKPSGDRYLIKK